MTTTTQPSGLYGRTYFDGEVIRYSSNNRVPPTYLLRQMLKADEISKPTYSLSVKVHGAERRKLLEVDFTWLPASR